MGTFLFTLLFALIAILVIRLMPKPYTHKVFCTKCCSDGVAMGNSKVEDPYCGKCRSRYSLIPPDSPAAIQFRNNAHNTVNQLNRW